MPISAISTIPPTTASLRVLAATATNAVPATTPVAGTPPRTPRQSPQTRPVLLAVLAHPDDEALQIGGWIAKRKAEGYRVIVVVVTSGELSKDLLHQHQGEALAHEREAEERRGLAALGVETAPIFLHLPDGGLDKTQAQTALYNYLVDFMAQIPQLREVITLGKYHGITGHPDHIGVANTVEAALGTLNRSLPPEERIPLLMSVFSPETARQFVDNMHQADPQSDAWEKVAPAPSSHISLQKKLSPENINRIIQFIAAHGSQFSPQELIGWIHFYLAHPYVEFSVEVPVGG